MIKIKGIHLKITIETNTQNILVYCHKSEETSLKVEPGWSPPTPIRASFSFSKKLWCMSRSVSGPSDSSSVS